MSPIPWAAILTHGPSIVAAAKRLFVTADANTSHRRQQTIEVRLDHLEHASMESARLLQEMAQQLQALTIAHEQTARHMRIALTVAVIAIVVAIGASVLAVVW
jgi:hypothetical protein